MNSTNRTDGAPRWAWFVAGALVAATAMFGFYVRSGRQGDHDLSERESKAQQALLSEIQRAARGARNKVGYLAVLVRIAEERDRWEGQPIADEIERLRAKLQNAIVNENRSEAHARATQVINLASLALAGPAPHSDSLQALRQKLIDVERAAADVDASYPAKITDLKSRIDRVLRDRIRDEANALAAAPGADPHIGLARFAAAEDAVRKAAENAKRSGDRENEASITETYKALLRDADAYYDKVLTPEFIDSIPWTDLLAGLLPNRWSKSRNVPGFSARIENGILTIAPPDKGSKLQGVAAILDQQNDSLRNFVLDMEFSVEGVATMFLHVAPPPGSPDNRQSECFELSSKDGGFKSGERYQLRCAYIGSRITMEFPDQDLAKWEPNPSWSKRRKGGIAFLIPEGTRLKVTRMRIKLLR